jgi:hypothetical protein
MSERINEGEVIGVVLKKDSHVYASVVQKKTGGRVMEVDYERVIEIDGIQGRVNTPHLKLRTDDKQFGGIQYVFDELKPIIFPKGTRKIR